MARPVTLSCSHFFDLQSALQVDLVKLWPRELEVCTSGRVKVEIPNAALRFDEVTVQTSKVKAGQVGIASDRRDAESAKFERGSIVKLPFTVSDAVREAQARWSPGNSVPRLPATRAGCAEGMPAF